MTDDSGTPLPGESEARRQSDELQLVLDVATSLGIKTDDSERDLRVYAPEGVSRQGWGRYATGEWRSRGVKPCRTVDYLLGGSEHIAVVVTEHGELAVSSPGR